MRSHELLEVTSRLPARALARLRRDRRRSACPRRGARARGRRAGSARRPGRRTRTRPARTPRRCARRRWRGRSPRARSCWSISQAPRTMSPAKDQSRTACSGRRASAPAASPSAIAAAARVIRRVTKCSGRRSDSWLKTMPELACRPSCVAQRPDELVRRRASRSRRGWSAGRACPRAGALAALAEDRAGGGHEHARVGGRARAPLRGSPRSSRRSRATSRAGRSQEAGTNEGAARW